MCVNTYNYIYAFIYIASHIYLVDICGMYICYQTTVWAVISKDLIFCGLQDLDNFMGLYFCGV